MAGMGEGIRGGFEESLMVGSVAGLSVFAFFSLTCTIGDMEIVVDASALLAVSLEEPEKRLIVEATEGAVLMAPSALPLEVGNALVALKKRGRLNDSEVLAAWKVTREVPVQLVSVDIEKSLELALHHGIYAYDAYYLSCSLAHQRPLLTLDKRMRSVARTLNLSLVI